MDFFVRGQVHPWVLFQKFLQAGGAAFLGANDKEMGQGLPRPQTKALLEVAHGGAQHFSQNPRDPEDIGSAGAVRLGSEH